MTEPFNEEPVADEPRYADAWVQFAAIAALVLAFVALIIALAGY